MATKKKSAPKIPEQAKADEVSIEVGTRSYQIYVYLDDHGQGYDLELKVGKQTDFGKALTAVIQSVRNHPRAKVR